MKPTALKKLKLKPETLRVLTDRALTTAAGGQMAPTSQRAGGCLTPGC